MSHLTRQDLSRALDLVNLVGENATSALDFARIGLAAVDRYLPSDLITLSVCDLLTGHRQVQGIPGQALARRDIAAFDRHFHAHPLVRFHGSSGGRTTRRISDLLTAAQFRGSDLYNEYYRPIGIGFAMALPLYVDRGNLVSFVLNRASRDFSKRDLQRLDLVRPHLGWIYRDAFRRPAADASNLGGSSTAPMAPRIASANPLLASLSARERETMTWVVRGKTDKEIARAMGISVRTVQKHLENTFTKLGVETRTAAAMRIIGWAAPLS